MRQFKKAKRILREEGFARLILKAVRKIYHTIADRLRDERRRRAEIARQYVKLEKPRPIKLATSKSPKVSIILYVHNQVTHAYNCLVSLQDTAAKIPLEILLVNDASNPWTLAFLQQVSGVRILPNAEKLGFVRSVNLALQEAKGEVICWLDQHCQPRDRWLESLLAILETRSQVGALSGKLLYEDGRLHLAGGITWQDGSIAYYGDKDYHGEPEYNYTRAVDWLSPFAFLVRASLCRDLGGLDERYASAVYAVADFCHRLHQAGFENFYYPKVDVLYRDVLPSLKLLHKSSDREQFFARWQDVLKDHLRPLEANLEIAPRRLLPRPTILVVDTLVPCYDKDSGSYRLFNLLQILQSFHYHVIFLPDYGHEQEPYTSELEDLGIEVLYFTYKQNDWEKRLERRLPIIDLAWVCRPELCAKYFPILQQRSSIKLLYDTVDLHFVRLQRQWELTGRQDTNLENQWQEMQALEQQFARQADVTLVVTEVEKQVLEALDAKQVRVIPNIHQVSDRVLPDFHDRQHLLFIGGYYHAPNVDAVTWLCEDIMPLVWEVHPEIHVTLLGSNPSPEVLSLAGDRVSVPGYIRDVEPYFLSHRVFVAPLRYGAGMKGKIGHSLSYGLPTVTTAIGAEGIGLTHGVDVLVADSAERFAVAILALYEDAEVWHRLSLHSLALIRQYTPSAVRQRVADALQPLLRNGT